MRLFFALAGRCAKSDPLNPSWSRRFFALHNHLPRQANCRLFDNRHLIRELLFGPPFLAVAARLRSPAKCGTIDELPSRAVRRRSALIIASWTASVFARAEAVLS